MYLNCAEFSKAKFLLSLKLVNIYPPNLKLTKVWDKKMLLLLCCLT